jgi:hypothetical protein
MQPAMRIKVTAQRCVYFGAVVFIQLLGMHVLALSSPGHCASITYRCTIFDRDASDFGSSPVRAPVELKYLRVLREGFSAHRAGFQ